MQNTLSESYWLRDWMNDAGISSLRKAATALKDRRQLRRLKQVVEAIPYSTEPVQQRSDAVLAGRGIDLSDALECSHWDCKRSQIDRLFSRVWHYFDSIVVVAAPAHHLRHIDDLTEPQVQRFLLEHMKLLLHLKKIGADDLLVFRQKPPACEQHLVDHLAEANLPIPETALHARVLRSSLVRSTPRSKGSESF